MNQALTPARTADHPVDARFTTRWSSRAFAEGPLSEAEVMTLLEAARWAPSASNHQPWRFVWALRGEAAFDAIAAALMGFNQAWAPKAGALIVVASKDRTQAADGSEAVNRWAAFDSGAAWMSLALQAEAQGLATHAMGGFEPAKLAQAVGLPDGHSLHAVVAVGHRGQPEELPEALRGRETPSLRRAIAESAFRGRF